MFGLSILTKWVNIQAGDKASLIVDPKYNILNFTESYRKADHRHTILLPVLMGLVVMGSFWIVSTTRPTVRKAETQPAYLDPRNQTKGSVDEIAISSPPKIDLDIDFDLDVGEIPVIDPGIDINQRPLVQGRQAVPDVPTASVIRAIPVSPDGLPLMNVDSGVVGRFTSWMTPTALNQHILSLNQGQEVSFWDRGHWIIAVEGRWANNRQEYRIIYEQVPRESNFQWRYRIAQSPDAFARNITQLESDGFTLVQSQFYEMPGKYRLYQAVWQRMD